MNKEQLLEELTNNSFVMLKPSAVAGIGVFAITEIKQGQRGMFSNDSSEWIRIPKKEIEQLPAHSRYLVENHCLYDEENYFVPEYGFKLVDPVIFLNHSDTPNVASIDDGSDFEALRDIREGEELFIDYGEIVDAE
jgi:SET domain-containing protein